MDTIKKIKIPGTTRSWYECPYCGKNILIYDDRATARGIFIKCKSCGHEVEITLQQGTIV